MFSPVNNSQSSKAARILKRTLNMNILLLIPVLPITLACVVHEEYNGFPLRNISDLGIAAIKNNHTIVEDLVKSGCEVNYNGTFFGFIQDNDFDEIYDEDYEYDYGDVDGENHTNSYDYAYGEDHAHGDNHTYDDDHSHGDHHIYGYDYGDDHEHGDHHDPVHSEEYADLEYYNDTNMTDITKNYKVIYI